MKKKMKQSQISLFCITKQATASEHEMRHNMFKLKSVAEHAGFATHFWRTLCRTKLVHFPSSRGRAAVGSPGAGAEAPMVLSIQVQKFKLDFRTQSQYKAKAIHFSRENIVKSIKQINNFCKYVKQFWQWNKKNSKTNQAMF